MKILPVLGRQDGVGEFWKELQMLGVEEDYDNPEAIVVLGGDGTLLGAQRKYYKRHIPFVGIGFGSVNFLLNRTITTPFQLYAKLQNAQWNTFAERGMRAYIETENGFKNGIAFNDIYIKSVDPTGIVEVKLNTLEYKDETVSGDGLIVSSPQGSTAYNRTAGGTILPLGSKLWCVTGICTQNRLQATVLQREIQIKVIRGSAIAVTDNKLFCEVHSVRIVPSRYSTSICFDAKENFEQRRYNK
ncbi:MAG: NAD(+)/NADH kinase [Candidatus Moraniibacteriota bacterium]|jgi:NAD+ kinase